MSGDIFESIRKGDYARVHWLLGENPQMVHEQDSAGRTPMHAAAEKGSWAIIDLLLRYGADINAKDSIHWTPLHLATFHRQMRIMELLIERQCDINAKNLDGWTPLQLALTHGFYKEAKLLRAHGGMSR